MPLSPREKITRPEHEPLAPLRAEEAVEEVAQQTDTLAFYTKRTILKGGQPNNEVRVTKPRREGSPAPERFPSRPPASRPTR
jgi:hypothetical protein